MPCCLKNNVLRNSGYGVVAHDCDPSTWMAEAKDKDKRLGFNRILLWTFSRRSLGVMEGAVGLGSCAFLLYTTNFLSSPTFVRGLFYLHC